MDIKIIVRVGDLLGEILDEESAVIISKAYTISLTTPLRKVIDLEEEVLRQTKKLLNSCIKQYDKETIQSGRG